MWSIEPAILTFWAEYIEVTIGINICQAVCTSRSLLHKYTNIQSIVHGRVFKLDELH